MKRTRKGKTYTRDPKDVQLLKLVDHLAKCGLTQQEVAKLLGISPGQLSRVKKGERHATWKHVQALEEHAQRLTRDRCHREKDLAKPTCISVFSIDQAVLKGLTVSSAVEAFRDLLWAGATAHGLPTTRVSISSNVFKADGGVDASILEGDGPVLNEGDLLHNGTRFQIKTGDFRPWQPSKIQAELFGRKPQSFKNLGPAIQRTLRDGKRFVLVCFGVDLLDQDLRQARENLKSAFKACGFPNASVNVWGQTQLISLFSKYPSLCLRIRGHDHQGFRSWLSWSSDDDMKPVVHYTPEQLQLVEELRDELRTGSMPHVRLIGKPGEGKTRLALEVTRAENLAPVTLYVRDGRALLQSSLINELIQSDDHRFVVFVIDECPPKDLAEVWNILKPRSHRIRLISMDHGPDNTFDDKMRLVRVEPVTADQITSILKDHGIGKYEASRWAEFCEGCPRVAHVLGENLHLNPSDLLRTPATVQVWDRFVVGRDHPDSEEVQLRRIVLRYVALFERFGFEPPVDSEARFIASMASTCDHRLTWPRFQSIVADLRQRRVVQGATTLYLTPRLLHLHLYSEFWQNYGSGFDIAETLRVMPKQLRPWFIAMLNYAHTSTVATAAVERLLGPNGFFPSGNLPNSELDGRLLMALAVAAPQATLSCLRRLIGSADSSRLLGLRRGRQEIVWALGLLAVSAEHFDGSAELLLRLAEAENFTHSNNATGTFVNLFCLIPGMASTQASGSKRIDFLRRVFACDSLARRTIALAAAERALSTHGGYRIVGPEHQGLRKTIDFWVPRTYGELWDGHRQIWQMLAERLNTCQDDERTALVRTMISSAGSALHIPPLTSLVLQTLESLVDDASLDARVHALYQASTEVRERPVVRRHS